MSQSKLIKEEFKKRYKTMRELHGNNPHITQAVAGEMNLSLAEARAIMTAVSKKEKANKRPKTSKENTVPFGGYGVVIGRMQPFHFGHRHIINEVMLDGLRPVVILGNSQDPEKNPLTFEQRKELIELVLPELCLIDEVDDNKENWTMWYNELIKKIYKLTKGESFTIYYHNKPSDKIQKFECCGKVYENEFYTQIFKDHGLNTKEIEFVNRSDLNVDAHATDIRRDLETYKHLLDARVYWKLKDWGW